MRPSFPRPILAPPSSSLSYKTHMVSLACLPTIPWLLACLPNRHPLQPPSPPETPFLHSLFLMLLFFRSMSWMCHDVIAGGGQKLSILGISLPSQCIPKLSILPKSTILCTTTSSYSVLCFVKMFNVIYCDWVLPNSVFIALFPAKTKITRQAIENQLES